MTAVRSSGTHLLGDITSTILAAEFKERLPDVALVTLRRTPGILLAYIRRQVARYNHTFYSIRANVS